jgi:hypothetical protein
VVCFATSGAPARQFKLHKSILADLLHHSHPFLARSQVHLALAQNQFSIPCLTFLQHGYISHVHTAGFPSPVVEAMLRYFYYHTLDLTSPPLPVDRLIFKFQMTLISSLYEVTPLCKLVENYGFEPQKDAEVYIAALRKTWDVTCVNKPEEAINSMVRNILLGLIASNLPVFMMRESFSSLMEERWGILSQLLRFILLPKDLSAAGVTDDQEEPVHLPVTRAGKQLTEMLQNFGI